jgi:Lar family restriction alleviation protein
MDKNDGAASLVRSDALLGCPFCGRHSPGPASGTYMIAAKDGQAVRCPTCNAHGPLCPTFDQAIAQWNHRKPNASVSIPGGEPGYAPSEYSAVPIIGNCTDAPVGELRLRTDIASVFAQASYELGTGYCIIPTIHVDCGKATLVSVSISPNASGQPRLAETKKEECHEEDC